MKYGYINVSEKRWINIVINIIVAPLIFIIWLFKIILRLLKIFFGDIFSGVYKKIISIAVFFILLLALLLIASLTNQSWVKDLIFVK